MKLRDFLPVNWFPPGEALEQKQDAISLDQLISRLAAAQNTVSGINVNPTNATRCSTVYAIVRVMTFAMSQLPLGVFRKTGEDSRERDSDHALNFLFRRPNGWQTRSEYFSLTMSRALLWGNYYALKAQGQTGPVRQIIPLDPAAVELEQRDDTSIIYHVHTQAGGERLYRQEQIHHIRQPFSKDGLVGVSPPIEVKETIALAMVAEQFGAALFGNGAIPYTVITRPGHFKDADARKGFLESWREAYGRRSGGQRGTAVLEEGFDLKELRISAEESQFLESRKFQKAEIAGAFGVPPHMVGDLERATFSNIEQQSLEFLRDSLTPWVVAIEQAIERDFLTDDELRDGLFVKFNLDSMLRADFESRMKGYKVASDIGLFNANEIRAREDLNPRDDEEAEGYRRPMNMLLEGVEDDEPDPQDDNQDDDNQDGNQDDDQGDDNSLQAVN